MKRYLPQFHILILLILATTTACSSNPSSNPVLPDEPQVQDTVYQESNRYLMGMFDIRLDPETYETEVIPRRDIANHWNVLKFLEQGPCTDCVSILSATPDPDGYTTFEIEITHPFPNPKFTGFDVRGIAIFNGSHNFPLAGIAAPDRSMGDGELLNPHGYTALYNSTTVPNGPLQGYLEGKFASPTVPNATINGFRIHSSSIPSGNDRNIFLAGDSVAQNYDIDLPDGAFVFGYAVDASWVEPTTEPVTDPEVDFPPEANCPEPYEIGIGNAGPGLSEESGWLQLNIYVYDHDGELSYDNPITVECPELFAGTVTATFDSATTNSTKFIAIITNSLHAPPGEYMCLITVEDNENATSPPHINLSTYNTVIVEVLPETGFASTWGGSGMDSGFSVSISPWGDVYVAGQFEAGPGEQVDFDPGPYTDLKECAGGMDIFISRYDPFGNYMYTETCGGPGDDAAFDIAYSDELHVYVVGYFSDTADLDPDYGDDFRTSNGGFDAFIMRLDKWLGNYWVNTWGGPGRDVAYAVSAEPGTPVHVVGYFRDTVDFDTDGGGVPVSSNGGYDMYYSQFDDEGNFIGALTWGGIDNDIATGVGCGYGNKFYIAGYFESTIDFDPTPLGIYNKTSAGSRDAFFLGMDGLDTFSFVRVWGWTGPDQAVSLASTVYGTTADVTVCGSFQDSVNFDPDGAGDIHASQGLSDAFIVKSGGDGSFNWCHTWGSTGYDVALTVAHDSDMGVISGGNFEGTVDFDPGGEIANGTSNGTSDSFITSTTNAGAFQWVRVFGGFSIDSVYDVAAFNDESVYGCGMFAATVNFAPSGDPVEFTASGSTDAFLIKYFADGTW